MATCLFLQFRVSAPHHVWEVRSKLLAHWEFPHFSAQKWRNFHFLRLNPLLQRHNLHIHPKETCTERLSRISTHTLEHILHGLPVCYGCWMKHFPPNLVSVALRRAVSWFQPGAFVSCQLWSSIFTLLISSLCLHRVNVDKLSVLSPAFTGCVNFIFWVKNLTH